MFISSHVMFMSSSLQGSQEVLEHDEWDLEGDESSCNSVSCDDSNNDLNAQLSLSTYSTHSDAILYLYFTFTGVRQLYVLTMQTAQPAQPE